MYKLDLALNNPGYELNSITAVPSTKMALA